MAGEKKQRGGGGRPQKKNITHHTEERGKGWTQMGAKLQRKGGRRHDIPRSNFWGGGGKRRGNSFK